MLYTLVRRLSNIALEWFYRDIEVVGAERVPRRGPILVAVNHPNAMVDAMVAMRAVPRRVRLTAKATLFEHPVLRLLFRWYGIIPLRRARDEMERTRAEGRDAGDPARNADAFRAVLDELDRGGAVLIFPEGTTHNNPQLAPLRTGLARLALEARDGCGLGELRIVPVGLVFERKWAPRTRILVHVGEPIDLATWPGADVAALTRAVDERLRAATLNFPTVEDAERVLGVARILARAVDEPRPLGTDVSLAGEVRLAQRAEAVRAAVLGAAGAHSPAGERAEQFLRRLEALRGELDRRRIAPGDVGISPGLAPGARFALREGAIVAVTGPVAWWGRINHWLPLRTAVWLGRRMSTEPEDPAMHILVIGLVLVLIAYTAQTALVWALAGARWALLYLVSLPLSASWDLRFRDRMRRAARRMRTYFQFRRDPTLQPRLAAEIAWLRGEALALEAAAARSSRPAGAS